MIAILLLVTSIFAGALMVIAAERNRPAPRRYFPRGEPRRMGPYYDDDYYDEYDDDEYDDHNSFFEWLVSILIILFILILWWMFY